MMHIFGINMKRPQEIERERDVNHADVDTQMPFLCK
jgi:hypothetical protein